MEKLITLHFIVRHVNRYIKVQYTLGTAFFALCLTIPTISHSQPQCYPPNNALTDLPKEISFDQFMGINLRRADPIQFAVCVGNAREYHDWDIDEVAGKKYPENEYEFHPANEGESVITSFDHFYNRLRSFGLDICATLKNSSIGVSSGQDISEPPAYTVWNNIYCPTNTQTVLSDNTIDPLSYLWRGDYVTQYVNRYGGSPASPLSPDQDKNLGNPADGSSRGLVQYLENWNEQDHWWNATGQFTPLEYATMSSVDFDGYIGGGNNLDGQKGCSAGNTYPIGLAGIGSGMGFVMGGLSTLDECYLSSMNSEFGNIRQSQPVVFPFSVLNFHNYSNTGGFQGLGVGISPEDDDLQGKLKRLDLIRDTYFSGREIWLSEFGYNSSPGSEPLSDTYSVPALGDEDRYEIQGQWIVRSFLAAAAADFDKAFVYEIRDATDNEDANWDQKCGLLESMYDGFQPKKSWFYTFTLKNVLAGMDFIEVVQDGSLTCNANQPRIYKFANPNISSDEIYAIWSPTSCDNPTYNFVPNFTGGWTAAHYIKMEVPSTSGIAVNITPSGGQFSVPVSERPIFLKPGPAPNPDVACPGNLMADNITCSSVILHWDIPAGMNYDHYQLWYGPGMGTSDPGNPDIFSDDITMFQHDVPGDVNQALVGNLEPNTTYYFYVIAHTTNNSTSWCNPIMVETTDEGCNIEIDYNNMVTVYESDGVTPWPVLNFTFAPFLFDDQNANNTPDIGCCYLPEGNVFTFNDYISKGEVIEIDLGEPYDIDIIYLYDGEGVGAVTVEYEVSQGVWAPYIDDYVTSLYLKWVPFTNDVPPCTPIQKLRVRADMIGDKIGELVLCGKPMSSYNNITGGFTFLGDCDTYDFQSSPLDAGLDHHWDFGDGQSSTEENPTHVYQSSQTYTVVHTVSNLCKEITTQEEIIVDIDCTPLGCNCPANSQIIGAPGATTALTDFFPTQPTSPVDIILQGTIEINSTGFPNGTFTFPATSNICMGGGAEIKVVGSSIVRFNNTHIRGCDKMWKSIQVGFGGVLVMGKNTKVEDGQYAIEASSGASLSISNTTFDKNYVDIYVPKPPNPNMPQIFGASQIRDNQFLSTGPFLAPYAGQVPFPGTKTFSGLLLHNALGLNVGMDGDPTSVNTFEGLQNGIIAHRTNMGIFNATFTGIIEGNDFGDVGDTDVSAIFAQNAFHFTVKDCNFTNCRMGIRARESSLIEVSGNQMAGMGWGISADLAQNRSISIYDNPSLSCHGDAITVNNSLGMNTLNIANNGITITGTDHQFNAIFIGNTTFAQDGLITLNNIDIGGTDNANIGVTILSAPGIRILENDPISFDIAGLGIYVGESDDATVLDNYVHGTSNLGGDTYAASLGLLFRDSKNWDIGCNTAYHTAMMGVGFMGDCSGTTDFHGNSMQSGNFTSYYAGLRLYNAIIGPQPLLPMNERRGNKWNVTQMSNGNGANYSGSVLLIPQSRFIVHTSQTPYHPIKIIVNGASNNNGLFTVSQGSYYECPPMFNDPDPGEDGSIRKLIADGKLQEASYGAGTQWTASRKLYRSLYQNPEYIEQDSLSDFFEYHSLSSIGGFYRLGENLSLLFNLSANDSTALAALTTEVDWMMGDIYAIDRGLTDASPQDSVALRLQRGNLLDQLSPKIDNAYGIFAARKVEQNVYAGQLIPINDGIQALEMPELNRRHVNRILLNTLAKGTADFDAFQKAKLLDIAAQCPEEGGDAVYQARGMVAKAYLFEHDGCESFLTGLQERSGENEERVIITEEKYKINLYPNPSDGYFTIDISSGIAGEMVELQILSLTGKVILRREVQTSAGYKFNFSNFPKGMYYFKLTNQNGKVQTGKIIIQ